MDNRSCALSPSQQRALEILAERYPQSTWCSNKNGESYIASGSAQRLQKLGLAQLVLHERSWAWQAWITDEGRAALKGKSTQ